MSDSPGAMVGRERELEVLRRAAASAREGRSVTVLVLGEAGVGKTRLASELACALAEDGWLCVTSHGIALSGGELPFGGTAELVRAVIRAEGAPEVRRLAGPAATTLARLVPSLADAPQQPPDRAELFGAVLSLIENLGRPVCWTLDDLQWMDATTRDLVAFLARVLTGVPFLQLATVRTEAATPAELPDALAELARSATVVALSPLARAQVEAQIAGLGEKLEPEVVARICEVSDGLPFFVEQLVREQGRVAGSLGTVLRAGLDRLTPAARTVLAAAAVGEGLATPSHLKAVSGLDSAFEPALDEVRTAGILRRDAGGELLRFRHALLREAVEQALLGEERTRWHRSWADHLEGALVATPLDLRLVMEHGRHRYAVGGAPAFPAVLAAAHASDETQDDGVRVRWWARALELWPGPEGPGDVLDRDRALARYASALWANAAPDVVDAVLEAENVGESDWLRSLWLRLARNNARRSLQLTFSQVIAPGEAHAVLARLRAQPWDFRVSEVTVRLADEWLSDLPDLSRTMLREVLQRAGPEADPDVMALAYGQLGWLENCRGNPDGAVALQHECVDWMARHHRAGLPAARCDLVNALCNAGRYADACELGAKNLATIRDARLRPHLWVAQHFFIAAASLHLGEWDRAAEALARALEGPIGGDIGSAHAYLAAVLSARRGDVSSARSHLPQIPDVPADVPAGSRWTMEGLVRAVVLAEIGTAEHDEDLVRTSCRRAVELTHRSDPPENVYDVLLLAMRCVAHRAATDQETRWLVDATTDALGLTDGPGTYVRAARVELAAHVSRVGDVDTPDAWSHAADQWSAFGRTYDAAYCRMFEAECALRDGERERARTALADAHRTAVRLGANPLRQLVVATARRGHLGGVDSSPAAPGLTPRETEVLTLMAEGGTNAQIATQLVMSPKTVSVHVSHIITKLGATNRTEASTLARRNGLIPL